MDKIQRDKNIIYHTFTTYIHTFLKKSFKILIYLLPYIVTTISLIIYPISLIIIARVNFNFERAEQYTPDNRTSVAKVFEYRSL